MLIRRARRVEALLGVLQRSPVCALLGPRQCGKTTLARQLAARSKGAHTFDLETAVGRAQLAQPELALSPLQGLVVIDEIQRKPELFAVLRPLADRPRGRAKFLVLGSASPDLVRGASDSLAGRIGFVDLDGFDLGEVGARHWSRLWVRGGFPRSYLAEDEDASLAWRRDFIRTFLERDLPQLGIRIASERLERFWMMLAHYHAQIWNGSELARSLSVSEGTVRHYLDVLTGAYVVRQLQPWFENIAKRQYRAPKVYVRDSGVFHALLSIVTPDEIRRHPKLGASWEGFALEQVLAVTGSAQAYYWGTHAGAELDLLLFRRGRRYGVEFKFGDAPRMTKSLHIALQDLGLERAWIVYPGERSYLVHDKVEAVPLRDLAERLRVAGLGQTPRGRRR
jgi:predicted AAA+ superfamily ATPase